MPASSQDGVRFDILVGRNTLNKELSRLTHKARFLQKTLTGLGSPQRGRGATGVSPESRSRKVVSEASAENRAIRARRGVLREQGRLLDDQSKVVRKAKALRVSPDIARGLSTAEGRELRALTSRYNYTTGRTALTQVTPGMSPRMRELITKGNRSIIHGQAAPRNGFVAGIQRALMPFAGGVGGAVQAAAPFLGGAGGVLLANSMFRGGGGGGGGGGDRTEIKRNRFGGFLKFLGLGSAGALLGKIAATPTVSRFEQYKLRLIAQTGKQVGGKLFDDLIQASTESQFTPGEYTDTGGRLAGLFPDPDDNLNWTRRVANLASVRGIRMGDAARVVSGTLIRGALTAEPAELFRTIGIDLPAEYQKYLSSDHFSVKDDPEKTGKVQEAAREMDPDEFREWLYYTAFPKRMIQGEGLRDFLKYLLDERYGEGLSLIDKSIQTKWSTFTGNVEIFLKEFGEFGPQVAATTGSLEWFSERLVAMATFLDEPVDSKGRKGMSQLEKSFMDYLFPDFVVDLFATGGSSFSPTDEQKIPFALFYGDGRLLEKQSEYYAGVRNPGVSGKLADLLLESDPAAGVQLPLPTQFGGTGNYASESGMVIKTDIVIEDRTSGGVTVTGAERRRSILEQR